MCTCQKSHESKSTFGLDSQETFVYSLWETSQITYGWDPGKSLFRWCVCVCVCVERGACPHCQAFTRRTTLSFSYFCCWTQYAVNLFDQSFSAQPIGTQKAPSRKRSPETFAHASHEFKKECPVVFPFNFLFLTDYSIVSTTMCVL